VNVDELLRHLREFLNRVTREKLLDRIQCGERRRIGSGPPTLRQRAALTRQRRQDRRHTEKSLLVKRSFF